MNEQFPQFQDPKAAAAAAKAYAKAQRPFYKKKRVLIPAALLVIGVASTAGGGGSDTTTVTPASQEKAADSKAGGGKKPAQAAPATVVSAKKMIAALEANALKAKKTYEDKRVTVTGYVGNIDASGDYFALDPTPDAFILTGIQVKTSDKFQDQLADFSDGQKVTVTGEITNVGEIMGYSLKAETIK